MCETCVKEKKQWRANRGVHCEAGQAADDGAGGALKGATFEVAEKNQKNVKPY